MARYASPYYIRGLDNLRYVLVMYLCGSPCISVCVSLGSGSSDPWPKAHGARRGPARIVAGPGYNTFCGTTGVELDSRRDGHAIGQSGSTDPYSTVKIPVLFPLGTSLCIYTVVGMNLPASI